MTLRGSWGVLTGMVIGLSAVVAPAQVVISEIMYNPTGTDFDTATGVSREWVELFNAGRETIDLVGWRLEDLQDGELAAPFPARTILRPFESLVVTGDTATFDSIWGTGVRRVGVTGFPTLTNSPSAVEDVVALRNAAGAVVDSVNYDDAAPWPVDSPDGESISLLPRSIGATANDVGGAWLPSMGGVYGARYARGASGGDRGSPGSVATVPQAAFAPSPDAVWSMAVLPDTQNYAKSSVDRAIFTQQTTWIRDNRDAHNIRFVLHEGDIVNQNSQVTPTSGDQSANQQWQNAKASMAVLDGFVPYAIVPGNHDFGTTNAQTRATQLNTYFRAADNALVDPVRGGTLKGMMNPGEIQNAYHTFTAPDGREMLVVALEWGPRQVAVDWARGVVARPELADHTAVLLTHAYMYNDETRLDWSRNLDSNPSNDQGGNPHSYSTSADTHDGQDLWNELVSPNEQFEMVFSGHIGGDGTGYLASRGARGQTVHQMLLDTQFESNGGNGWLRVVEFLADGRRARVRTYSPLYGLEKTDAANRFEFYVSPLLPGDFNDDGHVNAADYTVWRDLVGNRVTAWSSADGDGDGLVGQADLSVWRTHYGQSRAASTASAAVPEPTAAGLLVVAAAAHLASRRASSPNAKGRVACRRQRR
ncbi:MAG: lamin tail domain-containing protein [Lacipirellulaceae bacterium]